MAESGRKDEKLSATEVSRLKKPGYYGDGGNLWLQVGPTGGKSWIFRYTLHGKARHMGLGKYGKRDVSLKEARDEAGKARKLLRDGVDPINERNARREAARAAAASSKTFDQCAEAYILSHKAGWGNTKHAAQWTSTLKNYASPVFGHMPVDQIDTALVMRVLEPIWQTKTETASRVRGRIESVLSWAKTHGYCSGENPARWRGHLQNLLPKRSKVQKVKHFAALPYQEIGEFITQLKQQPGVAARGLEFAILTAARSGEVRGATWGEINIKEKLWTIPAERMKAEKEQEIPLSDAVVKLLKSLPRMEGSNQVFPAPRGGALSDMALSAVLKRMGHRDITVHGFRSSFRDWAGETTAYPREVIEHALAHQIKDKAEAAYARGTLLPKRRRLMADWSEYCSTVKTDSDNVVGIRGAG